MIGRVHFFLTDELRSGHFAVGVVYFSELVDGMLVASLGRNLPVTDRDSVIAKLRFPNIASYD